MSDKLVPLEISTIGLVIEDILDDRQSKKDFKVFIPLESLKILIDEYVALDEVKKHSSWRLAYRLISTTIEDIEGLEGADSVPVMVDVPLNLYNRAHFGGRSQSDFSAIKNNTKLPNRDRLIALWEGALASIKRRQKENADAKDAKEFARNIIIEKIAEIIPSADQHPKDAAREIVDLLGIEAEDFTEASNIYGDKVIVPTFTLRALDFSINRTIVSSTKDDIWRNELEKDN